MDHWGFMLFQMFNFSSINFLSISLPLHLLFTVGSNYLNTFITITQLNFILPHRTSRGHVPPWCGWGCMATRCPPRGSPNLMKWHPDVSPVPAGFMSSSDWRVLGRACAWCCLHVCCLVMDQNKEKNSYFSLFKVLFPLQQVRSALQDEPRVPKHGGSPSSLYQCCWQW